MQPSLSHAYKACKPFDSENSQCFEVLGFDIMLDHKLKPWLIEVNHSPSFATESELDYDLKLALVSDTFKLLGLNSMRKFKYKQSIQKEIEDRRMAAQASASK